MARSAFARGHVACQALAGEVSIVETEFGPCACSPLGKMQRVSMPYAPGQTPV